MARVYHSMILYAHANGRIAAQYPKRAQCGLYISHRGRSRGEKSLSNRIYASAYRQILSRAKRNRENCARGRTISRVGVLQISDDVAFEVKKRRLAYCGSRARRSRARLSRGKSEK